MKNWAHKGFEITFHDSCEEFRATVNGATLASPSLDAIRKKIDKALVIDFKPFKAVSGSLDDLKVFDVTGLGKSAGGRRGYGRGEPCFITGELGYGHEKDSVVPATPDNIALIKFANKEWDECSKIIKAAEARREKARHAIPTLRARDYGTLKVKP